MIPVWRRFGSLGSVVVTGVASPIQAGDLSPQEVPAMPTTDFPSTPVSVTFGEGITTALLNLTLPDNSLTTTLKVFRFSLLSAAASSPSLPSPRLSTVNTSTTISIIDDEGGAGQFQLSPLTARAAEGSLLVFHVVRSGGSMGRVAVDLQTVQSGQATSGVDYQPINERLVFESGITQLLMSVSILDDAVPEGPEEFSISLSGAALINANAVSSLCGDTRWIIIMLALLVGYVDCCD